MKKFAPLLLMAFSLFVSSCQNSSQDFDQYVCPATSCDTGNCCHEVNNGVETSGVLTFISCECPSDTTKSGEDRVTAGGPYNICACK